MLYMRSPIHIEFLDIARNLGVDLDLLIRLEFGSNFQIVCKVPSRHFHDGGGRSTAALTLLLFPQPAQKPANNEQSEES